MSTQPSTFVPSGPATSSTAGTVLPVAVPRFVMRAQYFNPLPSKKTDVPLPPHVFWLANLSPGGIAPIFGTGSDASGMSIIAMEDDFRYTADENAVWVLQWAPLVKQPNGLRQLDPLFVSRYREVFVDLEAQDWVSPLDVGFVDTRKLVRIPMWASTRKALIGGFKDSPPGTQFATTGKFFVNQEGSVVYGTTANPWIIQIDQGLFRNYVRFHYYDLKDMARTPVPRGPIVSALGPKALSLGSPTDPRIAAGTAIDDNGTVYLLHELTKDLAKRYKVHYFLGTGPRGGPEVGAIRFSDPKPRTVHLLPKEPTDSPEARYVLPREWHSFGMQAFVQDQKAGFAKRKKFDDLRVAGETPDQPLSFHLDDAVLASDEFTPEPWRKSERVALFDHVLAIRDEDSANHRGDLSKFEVKTNYLPAEDTIYVHTKGVDQLTRLVYRGGEFYDLRERRLRSADESKYGVVRCIGARIAMKGDTSGRKMISYLSTPVPNTATIGRAEYHLIDVSYLTRDFPKAGGGTLPMKLMHLLIHMPVRVEPRGASAAGINKELFPALTHAAERWDQKHPGHPGAPKASQLPYEFVAVPASGAAAGDKGIRIRHYFGQAQKRHDACKLLVHRPSGRAFGDGNATAITLFLGDLDEGSGGALDQDGQDRNLTSCTLAHELGHALGHPDDYDETAADGFPIMNEHVELPGNSFDYEIEGVEARPYAVDRPSIMQTQNMPRLRQFWVYASRLQAEADFKTMLDNKEYVAADFGTVAGSTLSSEIPFVGAAVMANADTQNPYKPVHAPGPLGGAAHADLALYRLPQDEGTVRTMFIGASSVAGSALTVPERFDGLALIFPRILFDFAPGLDDPVLRAATYAAIFNRCIQLTIKVPISPTNASYRTYATRFMVVPKAIPPRAGKKDLPFLRRIAIGVSPQFDRVSRFRKAGKPLPTSQHFRINLVKTRSGPHPLLAPSPGTTLTMTFADIDVSLICYILGGSPVSGGALKTSLSVADFDLVRLAVQGILGQEREVRAYP